MPAPDQPRLNQMAAELIQSHNTLTLATSGKGGAWAAPVYYAFFDSAFFFFSSPSSKHIEHALESGRAAAAISARADGWEGIRGMQMSGKVSRVSPGIKAVGAIRAYGKKFPFVKGFFSSSQSFDLDAFAERFRVRLYCFRPDLAYYLDNSIEFGFRAEVGL